MSASSDGKTMLKEAFVAAVGSHFAMSRNMTCTKRPPKKKANTKKWRHLGSLSHCTGSGTKHAFAKEFAFLLPPTSYAPHTCEVIKI